jgi:hypothetical protein
MAGAGRRSDLPVSTQTRCCPMSASGRPILTGDRQLVAREPPLDTVPRMDAVTHRGIGIRVE